MYSNIIQVYRTKSGFAVYKNRACLSRPFDKDTAFRIARKILTATKKYSADPVYLDDFTHFVSEV